MSEVKVSVVVPTYKRAPLLSKCLQALINQDFDRNDYEVIVVTDGEDEEACNLVQTFSLTNTFLHCISPKEKGGPAAARNIGWKNAQGELIVFTDDDCIPSSGFVSEYWAAYNLAAASVVCFTGKVIVPACGRPTDYEWNTTLLQNAEFITANCACSKTALQQVNGFNEQFKMAWCEDSELQFRLLGNNIPIVKAEGAVVTHPVRPAGWGISLKEQRKSMYNALLYKLHPEKYRIKLHNTTIWKFYMNWLSVTVMLIAILANNMTLFLAGFPFWLVFAVLFTYKRLRHTSKSISHVLEMIITSILIPFLSVYWRLYGSFKFKVMFL
ncbi:glycosyltransferase family A protein [Danxiaibacter flavus]|uniref:Glycosyltransferase family A protein n=1 Tax=Danxiaibacter flavus TaxID=3049108 RepID=A0ABV3ZIU3_9BACT|nr:glycosyltransferase family A protein [Chitinophagaceae bacterium DXS]